MEDTVKTVFVVGSVGLAAATGVLGSLIAAGGFAFVTYAVSASAGNRRMKVELLDEEDSLKRHIEFLTRFLDHNSWRNNTGVWADATEVNQLKEYFGFKPEDPGQPTWDMVIRRKQTAERRLQEVLKLAKSRIPKNTMAARMIGIATFFVPPIGLMAIGYNLWANRQQRIRRELLQERIEQRDKHAMEQRQFIVMNAQTDEYDPRGPQPGNVDEDSIP